MKITIFSQNDSIIGGFTDPSEFKRESFKHIIAVLSPLYSSKKECGQDIKEHLSVLYTRPNYTFDVKDHKFSKLTIEGNKIVIEEKEEPNDMEEIKEEEKDTRFVKFKISQLYTPISLIDIKQFILNKNESSQVHKS